jgi:phosphatidylglycerol:prolipoprotein diacylglycerol transferase
MGMQRILILCGGTVGMFLLMLLRRKSFTEVKIWKMAVISVLLTIAGVSGAMLMHFIEQGSFGGTSFFGAILFIPVLILPALLLRVRYSELADLCAPAECLMLAFMKVDCLLVGCCEGKYLPSLDCQFPSQIVEMIVILLGMLLFLQFERKGKFRGNLYACYLIFYGITRFILNWFRYGVKPFALGLPAGNFWSIIAIIFGIAWFIVMKKFCSRTNK